jgi:hypothetical protein
MHQIIVPGNHLLTNKNVDAFNRGYHQVKKEFSLALIREHFSNVCGKERVRRAR